MRTESRRTRKAKPTTPEVVTPLPEPTAAAETPAADSPKAPDATSGPERLGLTLRDDGTIETDTMRSATKEKLSKALRDRSLFSRLGIADAPTQAAADAGAAAFYPMVSGILYGTAGKLMAAFAMRQGFPPTEAVKLLFTSDEITQIAPLTGKVLEKWLPIGGKYQDEAMLAIMLFGIVNGKIMTMQKPATVHAFTKPTAVPPVERVEQADITPESPAS